MRFREINGDTLEPRLPRLSKWQLRPLECSHHGNCLPCPHPVQYQSLCLGIVSTLKGILAWMRGWGQGGGGGGGGTDGAETKLNWL